MFDRRQILNMLGSAAAAYAIALALAAEPLFAEASCEDLVNLNHRERHHQGLGNDLIDGAGDQHHSGSVRQRQRIGGLLYYYRAEQEEDPPGPVTAAP
jgi:hypothetical protein